MKAGAHNSHTILGLALLLAMPFTGAEILTAGELQPASGTAAGARPLPQGPAPRKQPASPDRLTAAAVTEFDANLSWLDRSTNEDGFKVERSASGGPFEQIAQVSSNSTSYRDRNLFPNSRYRYRVFAYNSNGNSEPSNQAEARTASPPCALAVTEWGNISGSPPAELKEVVAIAAGESHTLALLSNGEVAGWGDNTSGQAAPPTNLDSVVAVATGAYHSLALREHGTVAAWGDNSFGQSVPPANLTNVAAISAGQWHSLALTRQGVVVGWGDDSNGATTPPANLASIVSVCAGGYHSLALRSDGTVVGWGDNSRGQTTPPTNLAGVIALAAGSGHSLALRKNGTVVGWGDNTYGQAIPPANLAHVLAIAARDDESLALKSDGTVVAWGYNPYTSDPVPPNLDGVVAIAAGGSHNSVLATTPAMPSSVSAKIATPHRIDVSWRDNSTDETSFKIERAFDNGQSSPGPWVPVAMVKAGVTNYTDRNVTTNVTYWYRVNARDHCGESPYSDPLLISVVPPGTPYGLVANMGTSGRVNLSWYDDPGNADGFKIERAPDVGGNPGAWSQIASNSAPQTYADSSAPGNAIYWYRVRAFNVLGLSPYSDPASVQVVPPNGPTSLTVQPLADKANLAWYESFSPGNIENFKIERAPDDGGVPGAWAQIATVTNADGYTDAGLAANTIYWYRVRASNWVGDSPPSNEAFVIILAPISPLSLSATIGMSNQVDLGWSDSFADQDGFKVERATDAGGGPGTWSQIATVSQSNTYNGYFSDSGAPANTTVWYRVQAFNKLGASPYSVPVSLKLVPPDAPSLAGAPVSQSQIMLSWTDFSGGYIGYRLFRAPDAGDNPGPWARIFESDPGPGYGSFYTDTGRTVNVTYWYRLEAFNWIGNSPFSTPIPVTITPPPPPAPPGFPSAYIGSNVVFLSWFDYANDEDGFKLERAPDVAGTPGTWVEITNVASFPFQNYFSYGDFDVTTNAIYWYRVRAYNGSGNSPYGDATRVVLVPPAPIELSAFTFVDQLSLYWGESFGGDIAGYKVERAPDAGGSPGTWLEIANVASAPAPDTGLALNTIYWYRVRAYNWAGISPYSDPISATINPPTTPYSLNATLGTSNHVDLSWYDLPADDDGFILERALDASGTPGLWTQIATINAAISYFTTATDSNASPSSTYWYRVKAFNKLGFSSYSGLAQVSVQPPPTPVYPGVSPFNSTLNLSWTEYYRFLDVCNG